MKGKLTYTAVFLLLCGLIYSQTNTVKIDSLPFSLDTLWKINYTDNPSYASVNFDDSQWKSSPNTISVDEERNLGFTGFCWLRLKICVPKKIINEIVGLRISQYGASEIYLDGKCISKSGVVSVDESCEERFNPEAVLLPVVLSDSTIHTISIRYSNHRFKAFQKLDANRAGISLTLEAYKDQNFRKLYSQAILGFIFATIAGLLFAISLIHFFFYIFYRKHKQNIYFSLFTLFFALFFICFYFRQDDFFPDYWMPLSYYTPMVVPFYFVSLMGFLYYLILEKLPKMFIFQIGIGLLIISDFYFKTGYDYMFIVALIINCVIDSIRMLYIGIKARKEGVIIIGLGFGLFFLLLIALVIFYFVSIFIHQDANINLSSSPILQLIVLTGVLSIPISISLYLARNFATLNVTLGNKLKEVESLSAQMIEKEQEKKKILEEQNQLLEEQVYQRTEELMQKNKDIMDSIHYAKRIQNSLLPTEKYIERILKKK